MAMPLDVLGDVWEFTNSDRITCGSWLWKPATSTGVKGALTLFFLALLEKPSLASTSLLPRDTERMMNSGLSFPWIKERPTYSPISPRANMLIAENMS